MNLYTFFTTNQPRPRPELAERIIAAWQKRVNRTRRIYKITWGTITLGTLAGLVPAAMSIVSQWSQSGINYYLSVAFSDTGTLITLGKDLGLAVLESLPIMSLVITLGLLWILILAIKKFTDQTRQFPVLAPSIIS